MKKRLLSLVLALLLVFSLFPFTASAADIIAGGICGDEVYYSLDSSGKLTISGTGPMTDYSYGESNNSPFRERNDIRSVVIQPGVTSIGTWAFDYCRYLTTISLPDSITRIGKGAFRGAGLTSIVIPNGVTSIEDSTFTGCVSLTDVVIPNSVTSIGGHVFNTCDSLTSITIPEGVKSIGDYVFSNCSALQSVTLPEGLTSLGEFAFFSCVSLTNVSIPSSLKTIQEGVFCSDLCENSPRLQVYYNGTKEQWNAVYIKDDNKRLRDAKIHFPGPAIVDSGTCGENVSWTLDVNGLLTISGSGKITSSPWTASAVRSVVIEYGVTSIDRATFRNCSNMTSVVIPEGVSVIWDDTFSGCSELKSVTIPKSVSTIETYAFADCSELETVTFSEGISNIGRYAFRGCESLTSVTIPKSVRRIGEGAFSGCSNMTEVNLPDTLSVIEDFAFSNCSSLTSVSIPSKVSTLGRFIFSGCTNLQSVTLPDTLPIISDYMFCNCSALQNITIPEQVTSIGEYAFSGCSNMAEMNIPDSVSTIGKGAFSDCANLTDVVIPASVTSLGGWAFSECIALQSVTIPSSITEISEYLFNGCTALTSVSIPVEVTAVQNNAFRECTSLSDVYYGGSSEQWRAVTIGAGNEPLTAAAIHSVEPELPIKITAQPMPFYGYPADTAVFTVEAVGEGLTYQWYFSDNGGATWGKSGSTGWNTESLQPVLRANNSGRLFKCVITDAEGNVVETEPAVMALLSSEITIVNPPVNYVGHTYDNATFHVEAEGENLTYLWHFRDSDDAAWAQTWADGYNTDTLTVTLLAYRDGRQFRCEIKSGGGDPVYTEPVTMTLAKTDVVIVNQPADVTAKAMSLNTFHVDAEGENLTYRWYVKQGADAEWEPSFNDGYNSDTLNVRLYEYRDGYQYKCEIMSGGKNPVETDAVTLRMIPKTAAITSQPESVCSEPNKTVTFSVGATGEDLTYQWQFRKTADAAWANTGMTGNQTDTLSVVAIAGRSGYQFRCAVTDSSGSVTYTTAADLKVGALPKIISQPQSYVGAPATTAVFSVEAEGEGLTYQWYYQDASGAWTPSGAADAKSAAFSVVAYSYRDGYQYRCAVTNAEGLTVYTDAVMLTVN